MKYFLDFAIKRLTLIVQKSLDKPSLSCSNSASLTEREAMEFRVSFNCGF